MTLGLFRARLVVGGIVAVFALLCSLILASMAYATSLETRQAESKSPLPTGTSLYTDSAASGRANNAVAYDRKATINYGFGVTSDHYVTQVTVRSRNSHQSAGSVKLSLVLDGVAQSSRIISKSATNYQDRSWSVSLGAGNHTLGVRATHLGGANRLYTDYITLSGNVTSSGADSVADLTDACPNEAGPSSQNSCLLYPPSPDGATCTANLQSQIDAAPSGGTLTLDPCIYRQRATITKPVTIQGQSGTQISGSDVVTRWDPSGDNYISDVVVPPFRAQPSGYSCQGVTSGCQRQEQVFVDGTQLQQLPIGTDPSAGQFSLDSSRHVVLGSDPTGHTVEVTMRDQWLKISSAASGTTIQGITFKDAASPAGYHGALLGDGASSITVQDNKLYDTHGSALSLNGGTAMTAQNNEIYRAGQLAVHSHTGVLTLTGNRIYDSNAMLYNSGWEAGGVKATKQSGGRWSYNEVHNSLHAPGLWCDLSCQGVEIDHNRVDHSGKAGIFYEVSFDGKIHNNVLFENGWSEKRADLRIGNSPGTEAYGNVIAWSYIPMSIEMSNRSDVAGANDVRNDWLHDNFIISKDYPSTASANACDRPLAARVCDFYDGRLYDYTRNNTFSHNAYWYGTSEGSQSRWNTNGGGYQTLSGWTGILRTEGERYMTNAEKDQKIAEYGLPAQPEH